MKEQKEWTVLESLGLLLLLFLVYILIIFAGPAESSEPVNKVGDCPPGWSTSGKYCVPGKYARYIVEKKGECPIGYQTTGKYCMKIGK